MKGNSTHANESIVNKGNTNILELLPNIWDEIVFKASFLCQLRQMNKV
jgi:hypothetical protein